MQAISKSKMTQKQAVKLLLGFLFVIFYKLSIAGCFNPVASSGLPYNIIIDSISINNSNLPIGSYIAVFDGTLCVGEVEYSGAESTQLVAWEGDLTQSLQGFSSGNTMTFKVCIYQSSTDSVIIEANPIYIQGNGEFGYGTFTVVDFYLSSGIISSQNFAIDNGINVFPNPFKNQIEIRSSESLKNLESIQIYNLIGKKTYTQRCKSESNSLIINDLKLPAGDFVLYYFFKDGTSKSEMLIRVN